MKIKELKNSNYQNGTYSFSREGGEIIYALEEKEEVSHESQFFAFDFENLNDFAARLEIHFYKNRDEKHPKPEFSITTGILPHIATVVEIPLSYLDGQNLFGARRKGILKTVVNGTRMALSDIHYVGIYMAGCHVEPVLKIENPRFTSNKAAPESNFSYDDLIDSYGQRKDKDWPGKTYELSELAIYLNQELSLAKAYLADYEDGFYGIYEAEEAEEAKYEATGYYRLEKTIKEKDNFNDAKTEWQMITPDGHAFFGFGCDVVGPEVTGPFADEKEHEFALSNLAKVWGDKAYENWCILTKYRLIKWGINTVAAWSDLNFARQSKLPYVTIFESYPDTENKIYRDFPDVFSKDFQESALRYAKALENFKDDPYLIGYFMANEPNWAFVWGLNLGYETFTGSSNLASKVRLIDWLKGYYPTVEDLNQDFGTDFRSFEEILYTTAKLTLHEKAFDVLQKFSAILIEEFIKVPAQALKAVDSQHLNLGIRYAFISDDSLYAGAEYLDVFSINSYDNSPVKNIEKVFKATGKPVMIGEFHFGALDRGLPATGIRAVANQRARGKAIASYIDGAHETGHCVGAHYFSLYDQPYLGRFDGENYNIGLLDICNREYNEVTSIMQPIERIPEIFY
ncbi:MAG: beta-galactosidase [Streptococcaceae bacterium]|jgi:hypothetical protein|nr:beta-galactosidase [Streptococcaceae bacterium]